MTFDRYLRVRRWIAALVLFGLGALPAAAKADAALDDGMGKLAAAVAEFLKQENQSAVIVGDFVAPPRLQSSGGPGISQLLTQHFEAKGITVRTDDAYQV